MSAVRWSALEPETRASIEAQRIDLSQSARMLARTCGCSTNPDGSRVWLCQYHEGFDDAASDNAEVERLRGWNVRLLAAIEAHRNDGRNPPKYVKTIRNVRLWNVAAEVRAEMEDIHDFVRRLCEQVDELCEQRIERNAEIARLRKLVGQTIECVISGDTGTVNLLGPPEAVEAVRNLKTERDRLRATMAKAVEELDAEHRPQEWNDRNLPPIGCVLCYPGDGSWPCTARMIADDLRAALGEGS